LPKYEKWIFEHQTAPNYQEPPKHNEKAGLGPHHMTQQKTQQKTHIQHIHHDITWKALAETKLCFKNSQSGDVE